MSMQLTRLALSVLVLVWICIINVPCTILSGHGMSQMEEISNPELKTEQINQLENFDAHSGKQTIGMYTSP